MRRIIRHLTIATVLISLASGMPNALALPASVLPVTVQPEQSPIPVNGLLCGRGWHWSYPYFKCERNRHRCPAGKHWISLLRTCVGF